MFLTSQLSSGQFIEALDHQSFLLIQTNLNLKALPIPHFTQILQIAHFTQILHFRSNSNSEILPIGCFVQILLQNLILN